MARSIAIQYGDGCAAIEFWRSSLYFFNLFGKVPSPLKHCILLKGQDVSYRLLQFKYRIEAAELIAAAMGVYGGGTAVNVKFNRYCNDQGLKNTNKPADLKVMHYMYHIICGIFPISNFQLIPMLKLFEYLLFILDTTSM